MLDDVNAVWVQNTISSALHPLECDTFRPPHPSQQRLVCCLSPSPEPRALPRPSYKIIRTEIISEPSDKGH